MQDENGFASIRAMSSNFLMRDLLKIWFTPALTLISVVIFTIAVSVLYTNYQKRFEALRSQTLAEAIAGDLNREIQGRVALLTVLSELHPSPKNLGALSQNLTEIFENLYAVNLVSPNGVIETVYPKEKNILAMGQNLLENDDVRNYLLEAKSDRRPKMSHRVLTYQGVYAFTLYIPLFSSGNEFRGWLNGVIDLDGWLRAYLSRSTLRNTNITITWVDLINAQSTYGPPPSSPSHEFEYQVLNQKIKIDVGFSQGHMDLVRDRLYVLLLLTGGLLLILISAFVAKLTLAKIQLTKSNLHMGVKNSLLSSLTHDFSTPLTILGMTLRKGLQENPNAFSEKDQSYCLRALKSMEEILTSAKHMHAQGMGLSKLALQPTSLPLALEKGLELLQDQLEIKKVRLKSHLSSENIFVLADPDTLSNNVLRNVL
ncbi:hypothetical protein GW916_02470, partial [bacterium]|nr:hypothetical protein [bacterium]